MISIAMATSKIHSNTDMSIQTVSNNRAAILEKVNLSDDENKFLKKSHYVLSVKGNIFTCLQNAPFYIKHCRHIFTF